MRTTDLARTVVPLEDTLARRLRTVVGTLLSKVGVVAWKEDGRATTMAMRAIHRPSRASMLATPMATMATTMVGIEGRRSRMVMVEGEVRLGHQCPLEK